MSLAKGEYPDGDMWSKPHTPDDVPEEVGHAGSASLERHPIRPVSPQGTRTGPRYVGSSPKKILSLKLNNYQLWLMEKNSQKKGSLPKGGEPNGGVKDLLQKGYQPIVCLVAAYVYKTARWVQRQLEKLFCVSVASPGRCGFGPARPKDYDLDIYFKYRK